MEKFHSSKALLKMAGGGMHPPHPPLDFPLIIRFSSGSLLAILKNTVRVRLRFDKNNVKPVYKTPVQVRFDSLEIISD